MPQSVGHVKAVVSDVIPTRKTIVHHATCAGSGLSAFSFPTRPFRLTFVPTCTKLAVASRQAGLLRKLRGYTAKGRACISKRLRWGSSTLHGMTGTASTGTTDEAAVCELVSGRLRAANLWGVPGEHARVERTHLVAPEPFPLPQSTVDLLERLGPALAAFYSAVNDLHLRTGPDWVREYLDIGKSEDLVRHARMKYQKRALPRVIRPDILLTDDGPVITELDSVPGGIGHLDCLSAAYGDAGFQLVGSTRGMRNGFADMLRDASGASDPVCAIVVSDESVDYLPEMTYLAGELRAAGLRAYTVRPREVTFTEDGLVIQPEDERLRVDVVYRFFELFDLLNIPKSELLSYAARHKITIVTPPYKPFLEEKMLLALLHSEALEQQWRESLGNETYEMLARTIAPTYILDPRPVPPHAEISGFRWRGKPIRDWRAVAEGTQKERRLVIKPSGFSPLAWGSRGVRVGHDMSQEEWAGAVDEALEGFEQTPYVLQPFREASLFGVKYYDEMGGTMREMQARVRLCPYYFVTGERAELAGVLATACPKDKKLIHGMVDSVMSPCRLEAG